MLSAKKKLKGSVLGFSVILIFLFLFSGIALVSVAVLERKTSFATQKSVIAFQGAESGAERVLKRIYIDNSPSLTVVLLDSPMPADATLSTLADNLCGNGGWATCTGAACSNGVITGTNAPVTSPNYTFRITFYDQGGAVINDCADTEWRDKLVSLRAEGIYQRTARAVEIGIRPRQ